MKFKNPLNDIFRNLSHVKVFRVLCNQDIGFDLAGRQIADLAGISPMGCQNTLDSLVDMGLVSVRRAGRANLYRVNGDHLLVQEMLRPLFEMEGTLLASTLDSVARKFNDIALSVYLFGSAARGDEQFGSDLDIIVLVSDDRAKPLAEKIAMDETVRLSWLGVGLPTILVWTMEQFWKRHGERDPLLTTIIDEGEHVHGTHFESLVYHGQKNPDEIDES